MTLTYGYDSIGRLSTLQSNFVGATHPSSLASSASHDAFNNLTGLNLGTNESEVNTYDVRNRQVSSTVTSVATNTKLYSYNVATAAGAAGYALDGQILSVQDSVNGGWTYQYDQLNRISGATATSGHYFGTVLSWIYDRFGNHVQGQYQYGVGNMPTVVNAPNNRLSGLQYDAAGNVINDGFNSYIYDAENRLISTVISPTYGGGTATYSYDADGRRIHRITPQFTGSYIYDFLGKHIADVSATGGVIVGEVYADGRHLATYNPGYGALFFIHTDWLGTERARSLYNGATPAFETCASFPYGDTMDCSGTDVSPIHFTGKERDPETGNDYFNVRYYASAVGRMMSPDPANAGAMPTEPQAWNMYVYAFNNPLRSTDPTGSYMCRDSSNMRCESKLDIAFTDTLNNAIDTAQQMKNEFGYLNPQQFSDTLNALLAYGGKDVDNGVYINFRDQSTPGGTDAFIGTPSKTNEYGQDIEVSFDSEAFKASPSWENQMNVAHEGSHVVDAEKWAKAGFSSAANPTRRDTEYRAYGISTNMAIAAGQTYLVSTVKGQMFWYWWSKSACATYNEKIGRPTMIEWAGTILNKDMAAQTFQNTTNPALHH